METIDRIWWDIDGYVYQKNKKKSTLDNQPMNTFENISFQQSPNIPRQISSIKRMNSWSYVTSHYTHRHGYDMTMAKENERDVVNTYLGTSSDQSPDGERIHAVISSLYLIERHAALK
jgi:hypothetical protein